MVWQLDDTLFVGIEAGESVVIDDPDGEFQVTAFDANHCPGNRCFSFYICFIDFLLYIIILVVRFSVLRRGGFLFIVYLVTGWFLQ